jgi:hypothetical protein
MKLPATTFNRMTLFFLLSGIAPIILEPYGFGLAHGAEIVLYLLLVVCPTIFIKYYFSWPWLIIMFLNVYYLEAIYRICSKIKAYKNRNK